MSERYWRAKVRAETTTSAHIYHRIRDALANGEVGDYTFEQVEAACALAKEDGICIQTYGDPVAIAHMLNVCRYLQVFG